VSYQKIVLIANGVEQPITHLSFDSSLLANSSNGKVSIAVDTVAVDAASGFRTTFDNTKLSNGLISFSHGLNEDFPFVQLWSSGREIVIPDIISSLNANTVTISLASYGNIVGNWTAIIRK
jgi:hypothetical protein